MRLEGKELILRIDGVLSESEIKPKAKTFLLLNLCRLYSVFSPERAAHYWGKLVELKSNVPADQKVLFEDLQQAYGESESLSKGIAGELTAVAKPLLEKKDVTESEIRTSLEGFEEKLRKSLSPFGKKAAWEKLIGLWMVIDRPRALELSDKLNAYVRKNLIQNINRQKPLNQSEWTILEKAIKPAKVAEIVLNILNDPQPVLNLPTNLIDHVFKAIIGDFTRQDQTPDKFKTFIDRTEKFISTIVNEERRLVIIDALKTYFKYIPAGPAFGQDWPGRIAALEQIIFITVKNQLVNANDAEGFIKLLPSHLTDLARTRYAALLTDQASAKSNLAELLGRVDQKEEAETYYLVSLTLRNMGELACNMAAESNRAVDLLPRLRRAWIATDTVSAAKVIAKSDIKDDLVSELLLCASDQDKVALLRGKTEAGRKSLPADLWINTEIDEHKMKKLQTLDDIADEYTNRNPFYSTYRFDIPPKRQFSEYLRIFNFNRHSFNDTDKILLSILVNWADQQPQEVNALLQIMWQDIKPNTDLLKIDFLRTSILNRCAVVFSVEPDFMVNHYLAWLDNILVKNALQWSFGRTDYTLRLPETVLSNLCIIGASAVSGYSPARRDKLIETALTRYDIDEHLAETAAILYNSDKELLDLTLPWQTKKDCKEAWQVGIVKNAVGPIAQAVVSGALQQVNQEAVSESEQENNNCPECGTNNLPVARFCSECGSTLKNSGEI